VREQQWGLLKGLRNAADVVVLVSLSCVAAGLIASAQLSDRLGTALLFSALLIIPIGLTMLRKQQLAAVKRPAIGLLFDQGFAAIIVAAIILSFGLADIETTLYLYAGATFAGLLVTTIMVRRLLPGEMKTQTKMYDLRMWFKTAIPMMMGTLSRSLLTRMDVLMLAPLATLSAVGMYASAWRLTYVMTFPQVVLMTVVTPLISEAFAHENYDKIRKIMSLSRIYALVTTTPVLVLIMIAPRTIMETVFGTEFAEADTTLILLAIGQFFAAFMNANAALLIMGGREKAFAIANGSVIAFAVALNFALIPSHQAEGAAFTIACCFGILLLAQAYLGHKLMNNLTNHRTD